MPYEKPQVLEESFFFVLLILRFQILIEFFADSQVLVVKNLDSK